MSNQVLLRTRVSAVAWLLGAAFLVCGCGKLPTPQEVLKSADPVEPAAPEPPPVAVVPERPAPTPEEIVAGFLALQGPRKNDEGLQAVAEQTEQIAGLEELELAGSAVTDAGAAVLPKFTALKRLNLSGSRVSSKSLEFAAGLPALETLQINGIPMGDSELLVLQSNQVLTELSLAGTSIGERAFESLAALEHLQVLDVSGNDQVLGKTFTVLVKQRRFRELRSLRADSSGFGHFGLLEIGNLPNLEHLSVATSLASDEALKGLRTSKQLKTLNLSNNRITSAGLPHLKRLTQLEDLRIGGNILVGDEGIAELRGLKQLKELHLDGTSCTLAGVRELKDRYLKSTVIRFGGQEL